MVKGDAYLFLLCLLLSGIVFSIFSFIAYLLQEIVCIIFFLEVVRFLLFFPFTISIKKSVGAKISTLNDF